MEATMTEKVGSLSIRACRLEDRQSDLKLWRQDELLRNLEGVVEEAKRILAGVDARQLTEARRIQGFDVAGATAIFDSIPHFRGHTQEIVHMTRLQLGDAYKFARMPTTPEQGAPA
jgi:hypothetical protein